MEETRTLVKRLRRQTKLPIAVGFGITNPEQFQAAGEFSDGVVVGSAIVKAIENAGKNNAAQAVADLVGTLTTAVAKAPHKEAARNR